MEYKNWIVLRRFTPFLILGFLLVIVFLTLLQVQKSQETRQRASIGDAVNFETSPASITKTIGETFSVDLYFDGHNQPISAIDATITYDKNILDVTSLTPAPEQGAFDNVLIASFNNNTGSIRYLAVQKAGTNIITGRIKLGTANINAKAVGISKATLQAAKATAPGSTLPRNGALTVNGISVDLGVYTIAAVTTTTPSPTPTNTPTPTTTTTPSPTPTASPTPTRTPTPTPSPTPSPTPTSTPGSTFMSLSVSLPTAKAQTKPITVKLYNASNTEFAQTATLTNSGNGLYRGTANIGNQIITGPYRIKLSAAKYLVKLVGKDTNQIVQNIIQGQTYTVAQTALLVGDANGDNNIDPLDYNLILSCYGDKASTASCRNKDLVDFDEDGSVGPLDIQLYFQAVGVAKGD